MVVQDQNKRSTETLMEAAGKNLPVNWLDMTYPESTSDGRHLTNQCLDLMHVTKRAQVLNQYGGGSQS